MGKVRSRVCNRPSARTVRLTPLVGAAGTRLLIALSAYSLIPLRGDTRIIRESYSIVSRKLVPYRARRVAARFPASIIDDRGSLNQALSRFVENHP